MAKHYVQHTFDRDGSFTVPSTVTKISANLQGGWGGGGAGGNGSTADAHVGEAGQAGLGGGELTVVPGATYLVAIGLGGAGAAAGSEGPGQQGTSTTITREGGALLTSVAGGSGGAGNAGGNIYDDGRAGDPGADASGFMKAGGGGGAGAAPDGPGGAGGQGANGSAIITWLE